MSEEYSDKYKVLTREQAYEFMKDENYIKHIDTISEFRQLNNDLAIDDITIIFLKIIGKRELEVRYMADEELYKVNIFLF